MASHATTHAHQVCVVGDELVAGVGDQRGLGWVGRVAAANPLEPPAEYYQLAVPGETTAHLTARWQVEVARRFTPGRVHHLVFAPGIADILAGVSLARSRLNVANALDAAMGLRYPVAVVGPPPAPYDMRDAIGELSHALADVAGRRGITFVDTFTPLVTHEQWIQDLKAGDGHHPGQAGYGLMAWLVSNAGWERWLTS
ncbi:MAG: GDSL-type esterase/lipase family protein [Bifidobacteriaceae bacterium]|jgi:lysophospholipase L1-like esterase|nr:GDSL-type esterase/lipase family protein [Bifidobacteriaceae bacterium]